MSIDQILGLVTGILFGFLLQKGRVTRAHNSQCCYFLIPHGQIFA